MYIFIAVVALWNLIVFVMYGLDKYRAQKRRRRIRERTLLVCAFMLGGVGAWIGMGVFRHKTKHRVFIVLVPMALIMTVCATVGGVYYLSQPLTSGAMARIFAPDPTETPTTTPTPSTIFMSDLSPTDEPTSTTPTPTPTMPPEPFVYNGLVDLAAYDAGFVFDITYATERNFLGVVLYETALCLAHTDLAAVLLEAQAVLDAQGLRLLIYDCYRPMSVQQAMYDLTPEAVRGYVAKPGPSANHTKGVAVDCALTDADGTPLPMPSGYDEFSNRASVNYSGGTAEERANRDLLIELMTSLGCKVAKGEWWHFALSDASAYDGLDISFDEYLAARP